MSTGALGQLVLGVRSHNVRCRCGKTRFRGVAGCMDDGGQFDCGCTSCRITDGRPYGPRSKQWEYLRSVFEFDENNRVTQKTIDFVIPGSELWDYWLVLEEQWKEIS